MVALEMIVTLFDYHSRLWQRVWESILTLTDEQFLQPVDYSHGSLRNQVMHATVVEKRWLKGLEGNLAARHFNLDPLDYPTRQQAKSVWDATKGNMLVFVHGLDESRLESKPAHMSEAVWQILLHVATHGVDHRAQVLRILHDLDAPTFDQDFIIYVWSSRHA